MALPTGKVTVKTQDLTKFGIIDIILCYWVFAIYYHICYHVLIFVRSGFKNICNKQIIQNCLTKNSLDFGNVWKSHSYYICMFFPPPNNKLKILISWQFKKVLKENISQLSYNVCFENNELIYLFLSVKNGRKSCVTLTEQLNYNPLCNISSVSLEKRDAISNLLLDVFLDFICWSKRQENFGTHITNLNPFNFQASFEASMLLCLRYYYWLQIVETTGQFKLS